MLINRVVCVLNHHFICHVERYTMIINCYSNLLDIDKSNFILSLTVIKPTIILRIHLRNFIKRTLIHSHFSNHPDE